MSDSRVRRNVPPWLVKRLPAHAGSPVPGLLEDLGLATVCRSAKCPNLAECWASRTATLMILGTHCTRSCRFCAVGGKAHKQGYAGYTGLRKSKQPDPSWPSCASLLKEPSGFAPPDPGEPARVAEGARRLGLEFAVVTSVTRDDLPDGGAGHFAATVRSLHQAGMKAEVLVPDFAGDRASVRAVMAARPEVFGHNVETVPRLYATVRPGADYGRSLAVLEAAAGFGEAVSAEGPVHHGDTEHTPIKQPASNGPALRSAPLECAILKSGLMVGLGERPGEVERVLRDLRAAGCGIVTLGQYLRPGPSHLPVAEYVTPGRFEEYAELARALGFAAVAAGPFVRSSYRAVELWEEARNAQGG